MLKSLINFIAPPQCLVCGTSDAYVCRACQTRVFIAKAPSCYSCNKLSPGGKTCPRCYHKSKLSGVIIPYRLDGPIQELIYRLKYHGDQNAAKFLATKLADFITSTKFSVISFVPSDGVAQRSRGYNQAELLARELSRLVGLPKQEILLRLKHTSQVGHSRASRFEQVKDNFLAITPRAKDQKILLVDDVLTTGATLAECARALKTAGAKSVWGLVIAKK